MKGKIYKFACDVSSRERIFFFEFYQPASNVRVAYRILKVHLKNLYGWKLLSLRYWTRADILDYNHYKIN